MSSYTHETEVFGSFQWNWGHSDIPTLVPIRYLQDFRLHTMSELHELDQLTALEANASTAKLTEGSIMWRRTSHLLPGLVTMLTSLAHGEPNSSVYIFGSVLRRIPHWTARICVALHHPAYASLKERLDATRGVSPRHINIPKLIESPKLLRENWLDVFAYSCGIFNRSSNFIDVCPCEINADRDIDFYNRMTAYERDRVTDLHITRPVICLRKTPAPISVLADFYKEEHV